MVKNIKNIPIVKISASGRELDKQGDGDKHQLHIIHPVMEALPLPPLKNGLYLPI